MKTWLILDVLCNLCRVLHSLCSTVCSYGHELPTFLQKHGEKQVNSLCRLVIENHRHTESSQTNIWMFFLFCACSYACVCVWMSMLLKLFPHIQRGVQILKPSGKKHHRRNCNFPCQNMSIGVFLLYSTPDCFSFFSPGFIRTVIFFFSTILPDSRCFYGTDNKGC